LKESVLPVCSFGEVKSDPPMGGLTEQANDSEACDNQTEWTARDNRNDFAPCVVLALAYKELRLIHFAEQANDSEACDNKIDGMSLLDVSDTP
jgi:hypothetical protein